MHVRALVTYISETRWTRAFGSRGFSLSDTLTGQYAISFGHVSVRTYLLPGGMMLEE